MRQKFVAGNWKMYTLAASARQLAQAIVAGLGNERRVTVAVCPPFPWLPLVAEVIKNSPVLLGAQDVHSLPIQEGAYTGEVSPAMLLDAGCKYVIVGHSERRHILGESDALVNQKVKAALEAGLQAIFCIGETMAVRENNQTEALLDEQLQAGLQQVPEEHLSRLVIAYEPVWAIGTGRVATPEQAQAAHGFIRQRLATAYGQAIADATLILYGGSVKPENVAPLLRMPDVDGGLVGGASLKADLFLSLVRTAIEAGGR